MEHLPKLARFSSKLVLQILPSVSATVIGGYLLAQIHVGQQANPSPPRIVTPQAPAAMPAAATPSSEAPTAREERATMRKVLKQRRENPETPEVVHPVSGAQPAPPPAATANANASPPAPAVTASVPAPAATDPTAPNEPVERAATPSRAKAAAAAPPRHEVDRAGYVPAPPPGLPPTSATNAPNSIAPSPLAPPPAAPAVASTQPIAPVQVSPAQVAPAQAAAVPPVAAAQPIAPAPIAPAQPMPAAPQLASAPPDDPRASRGPVDTVFSTLSSIVGHAANATGNTVNWVIDLPGKAISAGGRVINGPPPPPPPARLSDGEG